MSDDPIQKVESAEAWSEFCDTLKKAGDVILRDDLAASTFEKGEGLRYLGRLLRTGLMSFSENVGPKHPIFRPMPALTKMGLDNPDNYYVSATVRGQYRYRIRGNRGSIHYLSFAAQGQNFASKDRITGGAGHLEDSQLELDADGNFEIIASVDEAPGNWLQMTPQTTQILVRQTFLHRDREAPVEIEIECLDSDGAPAPLDPARVAGQLQGSAMYAIGCAQWFADWVADFPNQAALHEFHRADPEKHRIVGGDPNIINLLGFWKLAPDEALVIETTPPKCDYYNFQLGNVWAESLDYDFRTVHRNNANIALREDGSFRLVVAHEDPGDPNWIDTAGHERGTMCLRWVRAESCPMPVCTVVKRTELAAA